MAKELESTRVMKKYFIKFHNQGFSIPEIANFFHVSCDTIYNHLQEIADDNGCSRKSLLKQPFFRKSSSKCKPKPEYPEFEEVQNLGNSLHQSIIFTVTRINNILEEN